MPILNLLFFFKILNAKIKKTDSSPIVTFAKREVEPMANKADTTHMMKKSFIIHPFLIRFNLTTLEIMYEGLKSSMDLE